ncbi:MAG: lysylphosphatidylglycerol synthase domain-containing protein, partial [Candidatus Cloacimonetes bacterium]|nr:lysylphosphatidylglycerol synthase domain-containing protein [Candidatus Cloacimonadota bacterium]
MKPLYNYNSRPSWHKTLLYVLKLALSVFIMWRIARQIDFSTALKDILALPVSLVLVLICLSLLRHIIQYHNWLFALRINPGYQVNKKQVMISYLIGLPLRFALPGGHASIAKIFFVSNSSKMASFWSTTLERSFMTWACWSFASVSALLYYPYLPLWLRWGLIAISTTLPLILYLILGMKQQWQAIQKPYLQQAPKMMSLQIANTLITYLQYWLILNLFIPITWLNACIRMGLTQFSNSIPITIAGLGLRESFAIHFLR